MPQALPGLRRCDLDAPSAGFHRQRRAEIVTELSLGTVAAWSYGLAVVGYLVFALRILLRWRAGVRASWLLGATIATAVWAGLGVAAGQDRWPGVSLAAGAADTLRYAAWFAFLGCLLRPARLPHEVVGIAATGLLASLLVTAGAPVVPMPGLVDPRVEFGVRLGLAIIGLILVEQLIRRVDAQARWSVKPLCVALAGVFGCDLFFYADALLFGRVDADIWLARGVVNAMVIPFIAIATARNTGWTIDMHVSRKAVFHSAALIISGIFLLAAASAGYYARFIGGSWGRALQIEVAFVAVVLAVTVASSGRVRSMLKVFVSKHFFSYRYDYREEWLRFTRTLSGEGTLQSVQERAVRALANLVESPAGTLWLNAAEGGFRPAMRWNMSAVDATEPADGAFTQFLARTGWLISLDEYATSPQHYPELTLPGWLTGIPEAWLVVPLASSADLLGYVVLATPRTPIDVNWEVRDLLKTASRQAASYLEQFRATEALLEARKFDAFNRMSAFVVHDLKNLVAQLSLMLRNAERHRDNPEFQRDMQTTVEHVVARMNQLLLQLRTGATPVENPRLVALGPILRRICAAKAVRRPVTLDLTADSAVFGHEDRLEHVIGHLVQNALDATDGHGNVTVRLGRDEAFAWVEVRDTGVGMTPEFVRERLFKPFETTKTSGMGIGVYESSQYVAGLGGRIVVDSTPGVGTGVRVLLPRTDNAVARAGPAQEVA
jgi:putative PEP-CTERM system histidine kinase